MAQFFEGDPKTARGGFGWLALGAVAAMAALLIGSMFPSLVPTRATQSRL